MKDDLCRAFCESLTITSVPAGLAVVTEFQAVNGEAITFYVIGPDPDNFWHIQDDGTTVPYIEAVGADLSLPARAEAFDGLLQSFGAGYDDVTGELQIGRLPVAEVPKAALRFIALLIRMNELPQTTKERTEAIWVEEAVSSLRDVVGDRATIEFESPVSSELSDWTPDVVLRSDRRAPVALYFGTSNTKAYEALLLHATARYQLKQPCVVVLLLENDRALTQKLRQRADNNIIVPRFRGAERDAVGRVAEEATGNRSWVH